MSTTERSRRRLGKLAAMACAAAILGFSLTGCPGGGSADLSPEAQAKAKQAFKKKSENYGRKGDKASR